MTIRTRTDGDVLVVTIDRPEVRNAVDRHAADALDAAFADFDLDAGLLVAVLTGAGGTFCAGADLHAIAGGDEQGRHRVERGPHGPMGPTRRRVDKPVIAAVEGHAVAGGLELALWCDLRVVARDAVFGVFCRRWGVPLMDGGTVRLPRIVGLGRALDLVLTGRPVSGDEALDIGLADRVVAPGSTLTAATDLAREIASFPSHCVRSDRRSVYDGLDLPLDAALLREHDHGVATILSGETEEGAARFVAGAGRHGSFDDA